MENIDTPGDRSDVLKSCRSNQVSYVKFCNKTGTYISLEWIDFRGHHIKYIERLKPDHEFAVQTFVGHPWMAFDSKYRYRMGFSKERTFVYFPIGSFMDGYTPSQTSVVVYQLERTLKQLCLQVIHKHLKNITSVNHLPIPQPLKVNIRRLFFNQADHDLPIRLVEMD
uniref:SOCS box domain-containing protein n=1 Tax=Ciona intestinalis TaxID=7719 RepID=H2XQ20_CIOIN